MTRPGPSAVGRSVIFEAEEDDLFRTVRQSVYSQKKVQDNEQPDEFREFAELHLEHIVSAHSIILLTLSILLMQLTSLTVCNSHVESRV